MANNLSLAITFSLREMRSGLKGFYLFISCLAIGVAAIAGVGTVSKSIEAGLAKDGRKLLGGDFSIRLIHRSATEKQKKFFNKISDFSEVIEMRSMVQSNKSAAYRTLVELKAVDQAYPLVGNILLKQSLTLKEALQEKDGVFGAVVDKNLLTKLNLEIGDIINIGEAKFRLTGTIKKEPDKVTNILSFGPRVMIASLGLYRTKLVQPGSQIRYRYRIALSDSAKIINWRKELDKAFPAAGWRIRTSNEGTPGLKRFIDRMTLFLTFVGLTTLIVGGVGVSNAVSNFLSGKNKIIAIYKFLGAPSDLIFWIYALQLGVLALFGLLLGVLMGAILPAIGFLVLNDVFPVSPVISVYPKPLVVAAIYGVLVVLIFSTWPLAKAKAIPATNLFRDKIQLGEIKPHGGYKIILAILCATLASVILVSSDDILFNLYFVVGTCFVFLILKIFSTQLIHLSQKITVKNNTALRLAITNLHRPGSNASSIVLSLGLGLTVLVAISLIEDNLVNQIKKRLPDMAPAFFFLDIQTDQKSQFDQAIKEISGIGDYKRVATLRGRIVKINSISVEKAEISPNVLWAIRGDRALTYANVQSEDTKITAGKWWPKEYSGKPLISLDSAIAKGFGVTVGDTLTLNVLGREIIGEIASLRKINWRSLRFDFAIIFSPGVIDSAPHSHIAALQAPEALEDKIEESITNKFKNVSIIRVREALEAATQILNGIGMAVRSISSITLLVGSLVLAGAIAAGRQQRIYDAIIFKVLGATRWIIIKTLIYEFCILGFLTSFCSIVLGTLVGWTVVKYLMELNWQFSLQSILMSVIICLTITIIAGLAGTWSALSQKAASQLRND
ncbi:MAG: ABC transporter permease [Rhodospirillales bacterium]|nr:ABC transporter permease [Rhodospirillales bacterium]